jgi:hypothetical protein
MGCGKQTLTRTPSWIGYCFPWTLCTHDWFMVTATGLWFPTVIATSARRPPHSQCRLSQLCRDDCATIDGTLSFWRSSRKSLWERSTCLFYYFIAMLLYSRPLNLPLLGLSQLTRGWSNLGLVFVPKQGNIWCTAFWGLLLISWTVLMERLLCIFVSYQPHPVPDDYYLRDIATLPPK